jgi:hypothetical protein
MNIPLAREMSPEDVARVLSPDAVKQPARDPAVTKTQPRENDCQRESA